MTCNDDFLVKLVFAPPMLLSATFLLMVAVSATLNFFKTGVGPKVEAAAFQVIFIAMSLWVGICGTVAGIWLLVTAFSAK